MAKFVIECPHCGRHNAARIGFFAKKQIDCVCGYTIDVKTEKMASRVCSHCGNNVVFDQSKGNSAICPVCKKKINTAEIQSNFVEISCPSCSCKLSVEKDKKSHICPLCDIEIDVTECVAKEEEKNRVGISVIKYEGKNDTFVWKHPIEDFNMGSQLIVHETQEAVFFKDGKALDVLTAGRHTLSTQKLPLLDKIYKNFINAEVFHSEIYFVNMTTQMGIKWGTDSKVRMFDPASNLHIEIGASGTFNLRVFDSKKVLLKLVGTEETLKQEDIVGGVYGTKNIVGKFRSLVMNRVKSNLARLIKENNVNILEVDEALDILSENMRGVLNEALAEYGLCIPEFFITTVVTPDEDPNFRRLKEQYAKETLSIREEEIERAKAEAAQGRKIVEAQTKAKLNIVDAQGEAEALKIKAQAEAEAYRVKAMAEAEEMKMKGYTYQQETSRMVGMEAMKNGMPSGGQTSALGDIANLGVSLGVMGSVLGMTKDALKPIGQEGVEIEKVKTVEEKTLMDTWDCSCGQKGLYSKFCPNCGTKKPADVTMWDCACGRKGIVSNFCPDCGSQKNN